MKGHPVTLTWGGKRYASCTAFAFAFGLDVRVVEQRLRKGIRDERLICKRLRQRKRPEVRRSIMYVRTSFGEYKV